MTILRQLARLRRFPRRLLRPLCLLLGHRDVLRYCPARRGWTDHCSLCARTRPHTRIATATATATID